MCILFVFTDPNPEREGYRLILASNRDEQYARPALPAYLDTNTNIIGGQDMELGKEGGTWLALRTKEQNNGEHKIYCIGTLLNLSGITVENSTGRGHIIKNYLLFNKGFSEYTNILDKTLFNGYNFVGIELSKDNVLINHHSNIPNISSQYSGKQIVGFGNSPINSPLKKVTIGTHNFKEILKRNLCGKELEQELLNMLKDQTKHLPDNNLQVPEPTVHEDVSSIFVKLESYGTRTHTLIFVDYDWNLQFVEHTLEEPIDINNFNWKETRINVTL